MPAPSLLAQRGHHAACRQRRGQQKGATSGGVDDDRATAGKQCARFLDLFVDMGRLAQQRGLIKGILLHQGESNTGDAEWPQKVRKIYRDLLADLKLYAAGVPLFAGEVVNADQQGAAASVNEIIAQLPQVVPTAHVVSSKGCAARGDHLHFTPAGYRELGRRYADAVLALA